MISKVKLAQDRYWVIAQEIRYTKIQLQQLERELYQLYEIGVGE